MSVLNFSPLAGLEVTEKFDLIYFFGWVGGRVGGRVAGLIRIKANLTQVVVKVEVGVELGNNSLPATTLIVVSEKTF